MRFLCSQLVTLCCGEAELTVNLEEIQESGAVLECEEAPPAESRAELRCGAATFHGTLKCVHQHAFGWRVELEFSPLTPWSLERFQPAHLFDPSELA